MNFRPGIIGIGFIVLIIATEGHFCSAQLTSNSVANVWEESGQPVASPEPPMTSISSQISVGSPVYRLHLNMYEAAAGDLSVCGDDTECLKRAKEIKSWACMAAICTGTDQSKKPLDCFEGVPLPPSQEERAQLNLAFCSFILAPTIGARQSLSALMPECPERDLVELRAYLFALKGSAKECTAYIKNYVGPYGGPKWNYRLYAALSGCRILAHESTRAQEEQDFSNWFGRVREVGDPCLDLTNSELKRACSASTTKSAPSNGQ